MTSYRKLVDESRSHVRELFPWDLVEWRESGRDVLLLDVREPAEFAVAHIDGAINVPRGILEAACEYGYEETAPELVEARDRDVVVICRSGNRSLLAARTLQLLGYRQVYSLRTGIRGWNDYEQPLVDHTGRELPIDQVDELLAPKLRPEQLRKVA